MTESEIKKLIQAAIGEAAPNSAEIADRLFQTAVLKVGRLSNVSFNTERVTFTLTANKQDYVIGSDILTSFPDTWTLQSLWLTDEPGYNIKVVSPDEFTANYAGSSTSGKPKRATVHSVNGQSTLSLWPIPDSGYGVVGYARKPVSFPDIPVQYHDAIVTQAYLLWQCRNVPELAAAIVADNEKDMQSDSRTAWAGNTFRVPRPISEGLDETTSADSYNLTGE